MNVGGMIRTFANGRNNDGVNIEEHRCGLKDDINPLVNVQRNHRWNLILVNVR